MQFIQQPAICYHVTMDNLFLPVRFLCSSSSYIGVSTEMSLENMLPFACQVVSAVSLCTENATEDDSFGLSVILNKMIC
jgi:hypothetical protein